MKRIFTIILIGSIFCVLNVLTAGEKEKRDANFLRINDNIQNEELRAELQGLREEFKIESTRIRDYYNKKIEALKEARRDEMKAIKADFSGRREVLMKKYIGKIRKKPPMQTTEPVKKAHGKMPPKDKKNIRKH